MALNIVIAAFAIVSVTVIFLNSNYRKYREVNGKWQVKEGWFGNWEDLEEHMKKEHNDGQ